MSSRKTTETLTREEAYELIEEARSAGLHALLDLQEHWIGHRDVFGDETVEQLADFLHGYVDEVADQLASAGWDSRSGENPPLPHDDDETDLTAPSSRGNSLLRTEARIAGSRLFNGEW